MRCVCGHGPDWHQHHHARTRCSACTGGQCPRYLIGWAARLVRHPRARKATT